MKLIKVILSFVLGIMCILLNACSGKQYEKWQIPTEYVDNASIESFYEDGGSATLTKEDANTLLQAYNSLENVEEAGQLIGEGSIYINFVIDDKSYNVSVIDIYTYIAINGVWYKCPNNQNFDDIFRKMTEKYNIKKPEYWKVLPEFGKFDEKNYLITGTVLVNDIFKEMGIELINDNLTINEFLKEKMNVKMNEEYKYENLTFKIIDKKDDDILHLFMQVDE